MINIKHHFINKKIYDGFLNKNNKSINYNGVIELFNSGKYIKDIASIKNIPYQMVRKYLIESGNYKKISKDNKLTDRDKEFIYLYTKELKTLQEIGDAYGITRERVRQRLKKHGYIRLDGGISMRSMADKIEKSFSDRGKSSLLEIKCFNYYGCSREFRDSYGDCNKKGSLPIAYKSHKNNAIRRGIGFELTLPEWIEIWEKSGHLDERGRGKYVMSRICDLGSYSKENVVIKSQSENSKEARELDKIKGRWSKYEYMGNLYSIKQLSLMFGLSTQTLSSRIKKGMSVENAIKLPINSKNINYK